MSEQQPRTDYSLPADIHELDDARRALNLSKNEFSQRAGFERDRWAHMLNRDTDPQLSTIKAFVEVIKNCDPDGPRNQRGRQSCLATDGSGQEGDA